MQMVEKFWKESNSNKVNNGSINYDFKHFLSDETFVLLGILTKLSQLPGIISQSIVEFSLRMVTGN